MCSACLAALCLFAPRASASVPLGWTAPYAIGDTGATFQGLACPSQSLCVAIDNNNNAVASTNPGGGASWTRTAIPTGGPSVQSVACASPSLCLIGDTYGGLYVSTNPGAATPTWSLLAYGGNQSVNGISCSSEPFCAFGDNSGNVWHSTNPASASSWSETFAGSTRANKLFDIACPSASLCVASDDQGDVVASATPSTAATWTKTNLENPLSLGTHIIVPSCATPAACFAADGQGNFWSSTTPGAASPAWSNSSGTTIVLPFCPTSTLCVGTGAGTGGAVLTSTNPTAAAPNWASTTIDSGHTLGALSCASATFCVALDDAGHAIVGYAPPAAVASPTITGTAQQGQTLTEHQGAWTNPPISSYAYQWLRCDGSGASCTPIPGATSQSYVAAAADVGHALRVQESASNRGGPGDPANSAPTSVVSSAPGGSTGGPGGSTGGPGGAPGGPGGAPGGPGGAPGGPGGSTSCPSDAQLKGLLLKWILPTGKPARIGALLRRGGYRLALTASTGGSIGIAWYSPPKRSNGKPTLIAAGRWTFSSAGRAVMNVRLTRAGTRMLRHARRLRLRAEDRFNARCGSHAVATRALTLRR